MTADVDVEPFDDLMRRRVGESARSFLQHYDVQGLSRRSTGPLRGLVNDIELLKRFADCSLRKKFRDSYDVYVSPKAPRRLNFNLFDFHREEADGALRSIESYMRALRGGDEAFMLKLQILRAQLIMR